METPELNFEIKVVSTKVLQDGRIHKTTKLFEFNDCDDYTAKRQKLIVEHNLNFPVKESFDGMMKYTYEGIKHNAYDEEVILYWNY